jgi:uncharacterized membrane protein YdfJ with MMPL/SSD domain
MLGSLTVLPALLSKLGDKVDRGRVPFLHRLRREGGEGRVWGAIVERVLRRPLVSAVLAGGLLVAIAVPAFQLQTAQPSIDTSTCQPCSSSWSCTKRAPFIDSIAAQVGAP